MKRLAVVLLALSLSSGCFLHRLGMNRQEVSADKQRIWAQRWAENQEEKRRAWAERQERRRYQRQLHLLRLQHQQRRKQR